MYMLSVCLHTDSKTSDKSSPQTRHFKVLGSRHFSTKQICSQLHDEVVGWNTAIHPETEGKSTQLHHNSLYRNSIGETDTHNALPINPELH